MDPAPHVFYTLHLPLNTKQLWVRTTLLCVVRIDCNKWTPNKRTLQEEDT